MSLIFIILRHVSNEYHNNHWVECYKSIRRYYTDKIYIIDSNSNSNHLNNNNEKIENCEIINSILPNGRLFSPFYYLLKQIIYGYDTAVIIHDSLMINQYIDFLNINKVKYFWHFETHLYDNINLELKQLNHLKNYDNLINLYNSKKWYGCLGSMLVIKSDFINDIENTFNLSILSKIINNKDDAISFERTLSVICYYLHPDIVNDLSYGGDIKNMIWGYNYNEYIIDKKNNKLNNKPFIKLFLGR